MVVDTITSMVPFWKLSRFMDRESRHLSVESMCSDGSQSQSFSDWGNYITVERENVCEWREKESACGCMWVLMHESAGVLMCRSVCWHMM